MRIAKPGKYSNDESHITRKIGKVEPFDRSVVLLTPKSEIKFIKKVETIIRSSLENKTFLSYLKEVVDMTHCSYFNNITNKGTKGISIHIHHEPFTLYDITQIVYEKWKAENKPISHLGIAEEVVKLHYQGRVGLIPLSSTVHSLVHAGKIFIPLQRVYGKYPLFVEEYGAFIPDDILTMLEKKVKESKELDETSTSILEKKYVYLEVDGFSFPSKVEIE